MKIIVKPTKKKLQGYCYGCTKQCQNKCQEQTGHQK